MSSIRVVKQFIVLMSLISRYLHCDLIAFISLTFIIILAQLKSKISWLHAMMIISVIPS